MAALQQTPMVFRTPSQPQATRSSFIAKSIACSFTSTVKIPSVTATNRGRRSGHVLRAAASQMVSESYATALAESAMEKGSLDATCADVEKLEKIFSDEGISDFFLSPQIDDSKKREILDELVQTSGMLPTTANFMNILIDNKRLELVMEIVEEFESVYNKLTDTEVAVVTSVVKLENQQLAQIAKQVQKLTGAKNVRIKTEINPSIVAGFTVRYGSSGSKFIDMSMKKQLEEIAAELEVGDVQLAPV